MNVVTLMGRLTKDPELRYTMGEKSTAICRYTLAVNRNRKRDGEPDADFFRITALGKQGEFAEKYLRKGTKILLEGEIRNNNYTNKDGNMVYQDQIIANSIEFAESKSAQANNAGFAPEMPAPNASAGDGFMNIPDGVDEELPFN